MDSHEIWHASTEKWNQLGDERGLLPRTISVDDSLNADTEESSTHSDSVIELSSDEEEEEDFNNEESDDSSDIEILEEIPFKPIKTNENKSFEEAKEFSVSKETTDAIASTIDGDHAKDVTTTAKSIVSSENNIGVGGEEKDNEDEHTENEGSSTKQDDAKECSGSASDKKANSESIDKSKESSETTSGE